jgi:hypothetical protein
MQGTNAEHTAHLTVHSERGKKANNYAGLGLLGKWRSVPRDNIGWRALLAELAD